MEKSIESIWQEGFLDTAALVAPKVNNLYTRKSINFIDKYNRMLKINLIAIIVFGFLSWALYWHIGVPWIGAFICLLFEWLAVVVYFQTKSDKGLDQSTNSYEYLASYRDWLEKCTNRTVRNMRIFYPLMFLSAMAAIWVSGKESAFDRMISSFPSLGWDLIALLAFTIAGTSLFLIFTRQIYTFDMKLIYGRVIRKLDQMIQDMEELREVN